MAVTEHLNTPSKSNWQRTLALGAICVASLGANPPEAGAINLVTGPGTSDTYRDELQSYLNTSQVPTPKDTFTIEKKDCNDSSTQSRASCIYYSLKLILMRPDLKSFERPVYFRHEVGHATDLKILEIEATKNGQQPDYISGVSYYRTQLLILGGKARSYEQAKYLIQQGPALNADHTPVEGRKFWAQEYAAQINAECQASLKARPGQKNIWIPFYGKGVSLRAKAYNNTCRFIKHYLGADQQDFETAAH